MDDVARTVDVPAAAAARPRSRRERSSIAATTRCARGSRDVVRVRPEERCLHARAAARSRVRLVSRQRGPGCTSCVGRWSGPTVSCLGGQASPWKSTRPSSVGARWARRRRATPTRARSRSPSNANTPRGLGRVRLRHIDTRAARMSSSSSSRAPSPTADRLQRRRTGLRRGDPPAAVATRADHPPSLSKTRPRAAARRPPGRLTTQAVARRHPPRRPIRHPPRLLPRRVHVPLQPSHQPLHAVCSGTGSCNRRSTPTPIPTMSSRHKM